ncbi:MAG TPA: class I SAM-dependent methyltransferase [Candidatus Saccharimonadales bacterium]|nr:class I SAM-dependent methyltransferase [Candidatus Saccharimonadales bacterium]
MTEYKKSVVSGKLLEPLFSVGNLYVSDFLKKGEKPKGPPCELALGFDPISKAVQLMKQPDASLMWGSMYYYRSAVNPSMRDALKDLAYKTCTSVPEKNKKSVYVDIASNDGYLLSTVDGSKYLRVGIDPSDYPEANTNGDVIIRDYFSAKAFTDAGFKSASRISCAACFYDLNNPEQILKDIYEILETDGLFTLQLSYTPANIMQTELGVICHEHLCYYNLTSLKWLTDRVGFVIKDVELNNVNGGSIRLYLQKKDAPDNYLTPADRDICRIKVDSLLEWEERQGFNSKQAYINFYQRILDLKEQTVEYIKAARSKGKSVWGYGASTKGNTLLQMFGLDHKLIDGIAEKQEVKWGRHTIGTDIPIYSETEMRKVQPDYLLILPWFFRQTFIEREHEYLEKGGVMIFPAPEFSTFALPKAKSAPKTKTKK